ncbi:MAG: MauE/DoxX family redox-associated membrane protein [Ferruginibacter sp.]
MKKKISLYVMIIFYLLAGVNHFRSPANYKAIIPAYLGNASWINIAAGISEILLAILLLFKLTRRLAAFGIILMLLAFIPAHVYMLQDHICIGKICPPDWVLWFRLFVLQPILIMWAWSVRNK